MARSGYGRFAALAGVTLLAWALRLTNLTAESLWVDEGITFARATVPWKASLSNLLLVGSQTPLYYVLLRPWVVLAGTSEFSLRFPSVLTATLTVPILYLLGREAGDWRAGSMAAGILALNSFHVWYAQEARTYALGMLCAALVLAAYVYAMKRSGWRGWIVLAVASGVAYLVHYFSLTLAAAQFTVFLIDLRRLYPRLRRWSAAQLLAAFPVAVWMMVAMRSRGTIRLPGGWIPRPSLLAPLYTFFNFSLGYEERPSILLVLGYALFLAVFVLGFRHRRSRLWRLSLLTWMAVPILVTFLISLRRPGYVDRYLSVSLPAFVVWVALGATMLRGRWQAVVVSVLLLVSGAATAGLVMGRRYHKEDWRSAVAQIRKMAHPGDRLVVAGPEDVPVSVYYLQEAISLDVMPKDVAQRREMVTGESRTWLLYRLPGESIHVVGEVERSRPLGEGRSQLLEWLPVYPDCVLGEWAFTGLYLALLDS